MKLMKIYFLVFVFVIIALGMSACKKKDSSEPSNETYATILLQGSNFYDNYYQKKESISIDTLSSFQNNIGVMIAEYKLPNEIDLDTFKVNFNFEISTNTDRESFNTANGQAPGSIRTLEDINGKSIEYRTSIPFTIGKAAIPNNDTIEISGIGDKLKAFYTSKFKKKDLIHEMLVVD